MKNLRILGMAVAVFAAHGLRAEAPAPSFTANKRIQVGANFGLCGLVTITPKPVAELKAYLPEDKQYRNLFVKAIHYRYTGDQETKGTAQLPPEGKQFSYGWAGVGEAPHFEIMVFTKDNQGNEIPLEADQYVTFTVDHNGTCVGSRNSHWELDMR